MDVPCIHVLWNSLLHLLKWLIHGTLPWRGTIQTYNVVMHVCHVTMH